MIPAARMSHLQEYFFARAAERIAARQASGKDVVNLGMGNPDLPPPDAVIEQLQQSIAMTANHRYPSYAGLPAFRQGIAKWYQREFAVTLNPSSQILPINGSKQGIVYLTLGCVGPGDEVLIPNPGYAAYEKAAVIAGGTPVAYLLDATHQFLPDLAELSTRDLSRVKLMWINYPHNPTGATLAGAELKKLAQFAQEHNIILVNDNPYSHVTFGAVHSPTLLEFFRKDELFLELSSLSKTYNMPGWRVGWVAGNAKLIAVARNVYSNIETGQFIPLQEAAVTALETPNTWVVERNKVYARRQILVVRLLQKLGLTPHTAKAALYVWAKIPATHPHANNSEAFVFDLLEKTGIFLAPGSAFGSGGEGYVRAAICAEETMLQQAINLIN